MLQQSLHSTVRFKQGVAVVLFHGCLLFIWQGFISVFRKGPSSYLIGASIISPPNISLALLSDMHAPFQAIQKEIKMFSHKRREIKRGIKELAKTVSVVISYTDPLSLQSKITFQTSFCPAQQEATPFFFIVCKLRFLGSQFCHITLYLNSVFPKCPVLHIFILIFIKVTHLHFCRLDNK